jgi:prevent-host-death family protein
MTIRKRRAPGRVPGVSLLMLRSREIGAAEFKARCLELIDEIERTNAEIVITRHRKPVARLVPMPARSSGFCGSLKGMILKERDLVSPTGEAWEADEPNTT